MTDSIHIPVIDGKAVIDAETAKNLVMLAASHETGPNSFAKVVFSSGEKVTIGPDKPAAPADDEATMQAMRREIAPYSDEWENIATDLIAAVRRGEVPGLTTTAEVDEFRRQFAETLENCMRDADERHARVVGERDALQAEVERLRADASRYEQWWKESCDERDKLEEDCSRYHHELRLRSEQAATFKHIVECFPEEPSSGVWPHGDSAGEAGWAAAVGTIKHRFGLPSKYIEKNHG